MFRWFKVLLRISREEDILGKLDARQAEAEKKLEEFERISGEVEAQLRKLGELNRAAQTMSEELERRIAEDKNSLRQISAELEKCGEGIREKLDGIQGSAEQYVARIHAEIQAYEANVSTLGEKMEALKEAVSELQR